MTDLLISSCRVSVSLRDIAWFDRNLPLLRHGAAFCVNCKRIADVQYIRDHHTYYWRCNECLKPFDNASLPR